MAIILSSLSSCTSNLYFLHPPIYNLSSSYAIQYRRQFPTYPCTPRHSLFPRTPSRRILPAFRSLSGDGVSGLTTKVIEADSSLALKNKAMEISTGLKGTSIFLVGMPSAIKTGLGKLLADVLRYYFFDSDSLVDEAAGPECAPKSFKERDEAGFLEAETEVLRQLSSMGRLVVCAGDGSVQNSTNLGFLRHGISIWIDVPLYMVANGLPPESEITPIERFSYEMDDDPALSQVIAQYERMRDGYATADATISLERVASQLGSDDMDAVTIEDMTMEVLKEIEKLTRVKKMMEDAARPF